MKKLSIAALLIAGATGAAWGQFEIKGYSLGQAMAKCPAGTKERSSDGVVLSCLMGPTTLANKPVTSVLLEIYEGRLASLMFDLAGRSPHIDVKAALVEKYGAGKELRRGTTTWESNGEHLIFQDWDGAVIVTSPSLDEEIKQKTAKVNKKDL